MKKVKNKIKTFENVSEEIDWNEGSLYLFSAPNLIIYNPPQNLIEKYKLGNEKYVDIIFIENNIVKCVCTPNSIYSIDRDTRLIEKIEQSVSSLSINKKRKILVSKNRNYETNQRNFAFFDLKTNVEKPFAPIFGIPLLHDNAIFNNIENRLDRYSFDGALLHSLELPFLNLNKYFRGAILSVYNKTAIIQFSNNDLVAYNLDNNEITWHITNFNIKRYQLDENDGKLKGLVSNSYFEIDVVTGDKKRFNLISHEEYIKNEMKTFDGPAIDSYRDNFVIVGDHIITTDSKSGLFGAFNTKTLKFDWWHEEPNVYFPAAKPIRYFDSLLFLLDHRDTLHIYKIEDLSL